MKSIFFLFLCMFSSIALQAQLERIIHDEFEVEEIPSINIDLVGDYELIPWAGNRILVETKIEIYSASSAILDHFIADGRYKIELKQDEDTVSLVSTDQERKPIRTKSGECSEYVTVKLFVPEDFSTANKSVISRDIPTTQTDNEEADN